MKSNPASKLRMNGFTDKSGNPAYNKQLSKRRVTAAYDLLVGKGISAGRITYDSFGEDKPTVPDAYPNSAAMNRRVEFRIQQKILSLKYIAVKVLESQLDEKN